MNNRTITKSQHNALVSIYEHIKAHHHSPTYQEIADYMGALNVNSATTTVQILVDKGMVSRTPGKARSILLTNKGERHLGVESKSKPIVSASAEQQGVAFDKNDIEAIKTFLSLSHQHKLRVGHYMEALR